MEELSREIKIIGVDKDKIRMSPDKKEHWIVSFKLSAKPDLSWEGKFYEAQKKDAGRLKRKARIAEGMMEVEIAEIDDLQKILDALKVDVEQANLQFEEDYQRKMKVRRELEELRQRQMDAAQKIKDDSDKLSF